MLVFWFWWEIIFGVMYILSVWYLSVVSKYEHHQSHFNLRKFLLGFFFLQKQRSKLSVNVYFFLALHGSTTIQSQLFLKNIKNFVWFPKQYLFGFFIFEKQLTNIPDRGFLFFYHSFTLHPSFSPYSGTELQRNKYTRCTWAGGTFLQLCCRVSFWFWREIGFCLHTYVLRVPYSCGIVSVFLVLAGNSFWYVCSYHTVVVLC